MAREFKETAVNKTDLKKYHEGYERIFGKKEEKMEKLSMSMFANSASYYAARTEQLSIQLIEAEKVIGFYAETESWDAVEFQENGQSPTLVEGVVNDIDVEDTSDGTSIKFGGKRAREYRAKYPDNA